MVNVGGIYERLGLEKRTPSPSQKHVSEWQSDF